MAMYNINTLGRVYLSDKMDDNQAKDLLSNFTVEKKMKEGSDNYIEEHDRTIKEIHEEA